MLDNAIAQFDREEARRRIETARDEQSTVDANEAPVPATKRRGLPEPPAWWNGDSASRESLVAARQLAGIKAKVKN